ncbi:MAG: dTDP-4-dehydrorhamnose 3,5-epimerase [Elusimicrobiota bacterium]|jgi:dTDP-4-dehydrorhamnose 3,5-epimerase|nr:dTDP-4-dehydrorhamnose 3,5-epimerase [Elusimicrobiota bacterium]
MKFTELSIKGAYLIELEEHKDGRGSFARQFCRREMAKYSIDFDIKQCNISKNTRAGTLRGLHYQKEPYPEIKMVSCIKGSCFDVIVDVIKDSQTYLKWLSFELSENNNRMLYIPSGVAHGFQTLEDNTTLFYQLSEFFMPDYYTGLRWNDPKISIKWPACKNRTINERDRNYELL